MGAEGGDIKNSHDKAEKIKTHQHGNRAMHGDDANKPDSSCSVRPDENGVTSLQQTYSQAKRYKEIFSVDKHLARNHIKRRASYSAPETFPIPPSTAQKLGQPAEKVDDAKVQLKNALPETLQLGALRRPLSPTRIQGQMIR